MINFSGSRILVVGGSSGIGLSTAKVAHEHGAAVTIASRSSDKVDAAVRTIGPGTSGRLIDVTSNSSVETFFADGTVWDHIIVTGSDVTIAAVRQLPLETAEAAFNSKFWGFYLEFCRICKTTSSRNSVTLEIPLNSVRMALWNSDSSRQRR